MNEFEARLAPLMPEGLRCLGLETFQVNLGRRCNLACIHCHLNCSPQRTEMMSSETMDTMLEVVASLDNTLVDVTGGSPELHPRFREFITVLTDAGRDVQVRTNLVVMLEPDMAGAMEFLRRKQVRLVTSMPCYLQENVDAQRGAGVHENSVRVLRALNALGYGTENGPSLHLVYNPGDAFLPAAQAELEELYRSELQKQFGITFIGLYTITNMPIGRFRELLEREHRLDEYMQTLQQAFNPNTAEHLMCRRQISVDWDGQLYDCDFNLALGYAVDHGAPDTIYGFDRAALGSRRVVTGEHCFGCTAGAGSSCGGALTTPQ